MRTVWGACAPVRARVALFLTALAWCLPQPALAQVPSSPSPEQIEAFQKLPPEQQRALLESMRGENSGAFADEQPAQGTEPGIETEAARRRSEQRKLPEDLGPPRASARATII